jgi:hypothetical protein
MYAKNLPNDKSGLDALKAIKNKNYKLLVDSKKDLDLLKGVVGDISQI